MTNLQDQHRKGLINDPIEVYLTVELKRNSKMLTELMLPALALGFGIPFLVGFVATQLWTRMAPAYNFYWGDYKAVWDRKQNVLRTIWVVGILGLVISVLAAGVSRYVWH